MNIRLTGRTALILAAGLWIGVAGHVTSGLAQEAEPAAAAAAAPAGKPMALKKFTKPQAAKKKVASSNRAKKVKAEKAKAVENSEDAAPATVVAQDAAKTTLPASVANANAQFPTAANANAQPPAAEPAADPFAAATPAQASPLPTDALMKSVGADSHQEATVVAEPGAQVVSPDEVNEIDRAAAEDRPALTLASATLEAPAAAPAAAEATSADNSTWDKTSLIGKIFIAFGGLLTMASAARMFIA
jgi:hypothetical protein